MKIKQTYMDETGEIEIKHDSLDIIADDGRDLFSIKLLPRGSIEISVSSAVKHNDTILDSILTVEPRHSNILRVSRKEYKR